MPPGHHWVAEKTAGTVGLGPQLPPFVLYSETSDPAALPALDS